MDYKQVFSDESLKIFEWNVLGFDLTKVHI